MSDPALRSCGSKIQHATQGGAWAHLHSLTRQGAHPHALNVYRCQVCGTWHVGHRPRRKATSKRRHR